MFLDDVGINHEWARMGHEWGGEREWEGWGEGGAGGLFAEGGFGEIDD